MQLVDVLQCHGYHLFKDGSFAVLLPATPGQLPKNGSWRETALAASLGSLHEMVFAGARSAPTPDASSTSSHGRVSSGSRLAEVHCSSAHGFLWRSSSWGDLGCKKERRPHSGDLLDESVGSCLYVRVRLPKTRRRGARVQHCKLTVQPVVQFV